MASGQGSSEKHGLFRLHPVNYAPEICDVDIVALHGLNGNAFKTWTDSEGHLWLRDSLPDYAPNARVMTFGYDSALRSSDSRMQLGDFAEDLLSRLTSVRQDPLEYERPIIFLCHSLGGLVAKQALLMAIALKDAYGSIVSSTSGVAFFGTPHQGSRTVSPARILSRIVNAASLARNVRTDLLDALDVQSHHLANLTRMSSELLSKIAIVSFYESKPMSTTGKLVVEPFSAILGLPNERAIPLNEDHRGITRCSPRDPQRYAPVRSAILELVEKSLLSSQKEYSELMDKLFCVDYKTAQLRARQPHPRTCDWIFSDATFNRWMDSPLSAVVLLSGPPGFGKTVLTRHVMEEVLAGQQVFRDGTNLNFGGSFFCSHNEQLSTSENTVLRSLLHQLLLSRPRAQGVVRNLLVERQLYGLTYNFSTDRLWDAIHEVLCMDGMESTLLCVDAIEELAPEDCQRLVHGFNNLITDLNAIQNKKRRVRIWLSSRPSIKYRLENPNMAILSINRECVEIDIRVYLGDCIENMSDQDQSFQNAVRRYGAYKIVDQISSRADGMFLWASIAWETFSHGFLWNEDILDQKLVDLQETPRGINALYDKMLSQVKPMLRKDMWTLFSILSVAKMPLREAELGELLAVSTSRRQDLVHPNDVKPFADIGKVIEKNFSDLITMHNDGTVLFSHLSFKEYLLQTWATDRPELVEKARETMSRACMAYIRYYDTLQVQGDEKMDLTPLAGYAFTFFLAHLASLPPDHSLWITYADTSDSGYFNTRSLSPLHPLLKQSFEDIDTPTIMSVAKCHQVLRHMISNGYDINARGTSKEGGILNFCCELSYYKEAYGLTVPLLLKLGADPNLCPQGGRANLKAALMNKQPKIKDALLVKGLFDATRQDHRGQTALHHMVEFGDDNSVYQLVEGHNVDMNIQDVNGLTGLHIAVTRGRNDVVRYLLSDSSTRLDLADKDGRTPLALATWWGLQQIALIIIQRPEAFPAPAAESVPAIMSAAKHGQDEIVKLLLPKTDPTALGCYADESGKGFLHHAAMNDWHIFVKQYLSSTNNAKENSLLGESTIRVNQIDHSGGSALHYAGKLGCNETCSVLLHYGASARLQNRNGLNAAQMAADAGFTDTLSLLLKEGNVDANQRDHQGRNLVHWAATIDSLDVMTRICNQAGVEVARKDNSGKRPIDYAWSCQCQKVGRYLSLRMKYTVLKAEWEDPYNWDFIHAEAVIRHMKKQTEAETLMRRVLLEEKQRAEEERFMAKDEDDWKVAPLVPFERVRPPAKGDVPNPHGTDDAYGFPPPQPAPYPPSFGHGEETPADGQSWNGYSQEPNGYHQPYGQPRSYPGSQNPYSNPGMHEQYGHDPNAYYYRPSDTEERRYTLPKNDPNYNHAGYKTGDQFEGQRYGASVRQHRSRDAEMTDV